MSFLPNQIRSFGRDRIDVPIDVEVGTKRPSGIAKIRIATLTDRVIRKAEAGDRIAVIVVKGGYLVRPMMPTGIIEFLTRHEPRNESVARDRKEKVLKDTVPNLVSGVLPGAYTSKNLPELTSGAKELADKIRMQARARRANLGSDKAKGDASSRIIRNRHPSLGATRKRHKSIKSA